MQDRRTRMTGSDGVPIWLIWAVCLASNPVGGPDGRGNRAARNGHPHAPIATSAERFRASPRMRRRRRCSTARCGRAQPRLIAERDADRFLCNVLVSHAWRNTTIEDVHAGARAPHALLPQQQRFTPTTERRLLREVSAILGSVLWAFDDLFDASPARGYSPGRRGRARSPARSTVDGPRAGPWRTSRRPSHLNSDTCCIAQLYLGL
jgi:hypothetical protein